MFRNRSFWLWLSLGGLALLTTGRIYSRSMYAPHYPDVALHAGLSLFSKTRTALAIAAHPGDLELHAGGTLFLLNQSKSNVTAAVLTAGEASPSKKRNIAEIRVREQEQARAILGYEQLIQLYLPDQGLTEHPSLSGHLHRLWEQVKPDIVFAPDPRGLFPLNNTDLAATGFAAVQRAMVGLPPGTGPGSTQSPSISSQSSLSQAAIATAREHMDNPPIVLLYGTRRPNVLVDITEVIQEKVNAVKAHRSQLVVPDGIVGSFVKNMSRRNSHNTPAYYTEGFYRVL